MTFDYYLKSQLIIIKYLTMYTTDGLEKRAEARRKLLKDTPDNYEAAVQKMIFETTQWENMCKMIACQQFYEHVGVERNIFEKS